MSAPQRLDHVVGDATGLRIPAHIGALLADGPAFLTRAFHRFGALDAANQVTAILGHRVCPGGSTGAKFFMDVACALPQPGLPTRLFVKFSRDFDDPRRDWQRHEMEGEARLGPLTRRPGFPVAVPQVLFCDYHAETGTGLVITECVTYGEAGIEPHRRKCLDPVHTPDPLPYYRATVTALARLAAADKAGALGADIDARFPFDPVAASADRVFTSAAEMAQQLRDCVALVNDAPQLFPAPVRDPAFLDRVVADAWRIRTHEERIQRFLTGNPDLIALCHWNAHIDNAFFWCDGDALRCGLIDWGRVGRITLGSALWGGLSAAHHAIWDDHLEDLLALYAREYAAHGGPWLTTEAMREHLALHMAMMGVSRVIAFPEVIRFRDPAVITYPDPLDPRLHGNDPARNCLHVFTVWLKFWHRHDFGAALDRLLATPEQQAGERDANPCR
ncbi:MAG: hypothetical protein KGM17_10190 [Sphingomonadales bacterium]|nr:hypothetical protein [Sphingomonadales bacterium]